MNIFLSIFIVLICLRFFYTKKHKALAFIFIFTLFNGDFQFDVGASVNVYHFITLLYIPKILNLIAHNYLIKKATRPLRYELIIIFIFGVLYGFIIPFEDSFAAYRSFTQQASLRSIISFSRMLLEFFSVLLVVYWVGQKLISIRTLIKYFSIVAIISVVIGILIYFFPPFFRFTFPNFEHHFNGSRFTGLVGEPRTFGRFSAFSLILLMYYDKFDLNKIRLVAIIFSLLGVILSLSASALIVTAVGLSFYFALNRKFSSLIFIIIISVAGFAGLSENEFFQNTTLDKIKTVVAINQEEKVEKAPNEPELFTRFEVFDRAALNFFYNNPAYLIFGVGPNLISIPASSFVSPDLKYSEVYGDGINSVPTTFFVNIIARSGIVGLFLQAFFFITIYKNIRGKNEKYCFLTTFIMSLITATNLFFLIIGISMSVMLITKQIEYENIKV